MERFSKTLSGIVALSLLLSVVTAPAHAVPTDFDFSGTFENDNDVLLIDFNVASASDITIFSSSWQDFDTGLGFDPILALWTGDGTLIEQQDDGNNSGVTSSNGVEYSHGVWDSFFSRSLEAGDYIASVVQYDNFARSDQLEDGFIMDSDPNFTRTEGFGDADNFNDADGDARTGDWEFHILNVEDAGATQNGEEVGGEEPVVEEPVVEEPVVEEPVIEEPVVEEPVVEEPVIEDPVSIPPTLEDPVVLDPESNPTTADPASGEEVPEPASVVLLISGLIGLGIARKRKA